jgi:hypothetical protein
MTPFSRPQYFNELKEILRKQNVIWHLICLDKQELELETWINVYYCGQNHNHFDWCYFKLNWFLDNVEINKYDRYGVICDDDSCQPDYFDRLRKVDTSVIITNRNLGNNEIMFAKPKNMRVSHVGFQFWAMGYCFDKLRFDSNSHAGDGIMAINLASNFETTYLTEAAGWYNALSSGRKYGGL